MRARALFLCALVARLAQIGAVLDPKDDKTAAQAYWLPPNFEPSLNSVALSGAHSSLVQPGPMHSHSNVDQLAMQVAHILESRHALVGPSIAPQVSGPYASSPYTSAYSIDPKLYSFLETSAMKKHSRVRRFLHKQNAQHTHKLRGRHTHKLRARKHHHQHQEIPGAAGYNSISPFVGTDYHSFPLGNRPAPQATIQAQTPPYADSINTMLHSAIASSPGFSQSGGGYLRNAPSPAMFTMGQPMDSTMATSNVPTMDNGVADVMNVPRNTGRPIAGLAI